MLLFSLLLLIGHLLNGILANTEIINFSSTEAEFSSLPFTETWHILKPGNSTLQWNMISAPLGYTLSRSTICFNLHEWQPVQNISTTTTSDDVCPYEFWLVLDLDRDGWKEYDKFTLRLSWPAYHPTDIHLQVYDPSSLILTTSPNTRVTTATTTQSQQQQQQQHKKTRRKYARIQMVHTGVLTPPSIFTNNSITTTTPFNNDTFSRYNVPFIIILEPLHFGVLPSSVVSVVLTILVIIVVGLPIAGKIHRYLEGIAQQAKAEELVEEKKEM